MRLGGAARNGLGILIVATVLAASCDQEGPSIARLLEAPLPRVAERGASARVDVVLRHDARHLSTPARRELAREVVGAAFRHDMDPLLILALIGLESDFRFDVVSTHGAIGLMQLQPATARWIAHHLGVPWSHDAALYDARTNVTLGVHYFAYLFARFGAFSLSLEAYNRGPNHPQLLDKGLEDNPLGDRFWQRVLVRYRDYQRLVDGVAPEGDHDLPWSIGLSHAELEPFLSIVTLDESIL